MTVPVPDLTRFGRRPSLREIVTKELRAALVTGKLAPGEVYSAPTLAVQFGVSATPVREAMLDLAKEGLVEPVRNKGFRVVQLDEKTLDDCLEIRLLIEPPTMAKVALRAPSAAMEAWRGAADEIVDAARVGDITAYIDADLRFHLGLLALAGNDLLVETIRDLRYRSRLPGVPRLALDGALEPSAMEHRDILDAMLARDADRVSTLTKHHLLHVRGVWAGHSDDE